MMDENIKNISTSLGSFETRSLFNFLLCLLLILLSPSNFLGISSGIFYAVKLGKNNNWQLLPLIFSISLFLSSLNTTKDLESDFYSYFLISNQINGLNILEFFEIYSREPVYYLANWFFVNKLNFDWDNWVFFFTFIFYFVWLNAIDRLMRLQGVEIYTKLAIILFFGFSPLIFSQSAHLVRQYLSGAIAFWGMTTFLKTGRGWLYFVLASLIHVSSVIYLIIPLSKNFFGGVQRGHFAFLFVVFPYIIFEIIQAPIIYNFLLSYTGGLFDTIAYGVKRLTQEEFFDNEKLSLIPLTVSFIIFALSIFGMIVSPKDKLTDSVVENSRRFIVLVFNAALSLAILLFSFMELTEPALRAFQYLLIQLPFLILLQLRIFQELRLIFFVIALLVPILFFIIPTEWSYDYFGRVLIYPYYFYFK